MQDWYLITPNTRPNLTGGYENDAYNDYKDDEFAEILDTDIASTVELCNSDLSERTTIRCVVQDNDSDTALKTMQRTVLFPCNTSKAGMYVYFENNYWIIDGRPGQCGVFEKTTMKLCQSTVKWQDADGNIHERWAYYQSASKYDVGKTGNNIILLGLMEKEYFLIFVKFQMTYLHSLVMIMFYIILVLNMVVYYLLSLIKMNLTQRKTEKTCYYVITLSLKKILNQRSQRNQNSQMFQL